MNCAQKDDSDQATSAQPEREQQTEKECEQRDENKMLIETPIPVESCLLYTSPSPRDS